MTYHKSIFEEINNNLPNQVKCPFCNKLITKAKLSVDTHLSKHLKAKEITFEQRNEFSNKMLKRYIRQI